MSKVKDNRRKGEKLVVFRPELWERVKRCVATKVAVRPHDYVRALVIQGLEKEGF